MYIGAHVSSAGGLPKVFDRARAIGAEAMQLFASAPQQWKAPVHTDAAVEEFRALHADWPIPVFLHGVYLINLGSTDEALVARSIESLKQSLEWGERLGATGTIFHVGSHLGAGWDSTITASICGHIRKVLDSTPANTLLVLENNAGQGNCIGGKWEELGAIIHGLDGDPRVGVCLDTCHAFAMGYDISTPAGCEEAMAGFDKHIGFERLVAVHANDSKTPLGGFRDRHENIGDGCLGLEGFATLMRHKAFKDVPFFLEVPGLDGKGPDRENVMRLKAIRAGIGLPAPEMRAAG